MKQKPSGGCADKDIVWLDRPVKSDQKIKKGLKLWSRWSTMVACGRKVVISGRKWWNRGDRKRRSSKCYLGSSITALMKRGD